MELLAIAISATDGIRNNTHFLENRGRKKTGASIITNVTAIFPRGSKYMPEDECKLANDARPPRNEMPYPRAKAEDANKKSIME
jgi:hypothetical protein